MVMTNEGLNRIRDLVDDDFGDGQAGTDTTLATQNDTALGTAVAATKLAVTSSKSDKTISVTHIIPTTLGNGSALAEFETQMSTADTLHRLTTNPISKTSDIEVVRITTFTFETE